MFILRVRNFLILWMILAIQREHLFYGQPRPLIYSTRKVHHNLPFSMQSIIRVENCSVNVLNVLVIFLSPRLRDGKQRRLYFSSKGFVLVIFSSPKFRHCMQRMTLIDFSFFYFLILFCLVPNNYRGNPNKSVPTRYWLKISNVLYFIGNTR